LLILSATNGVPVVVVDVVVDVRINFGTLCFVVKTGSYLEFLSKFVLKVYSSKALAPALVLGLESCKDSTTS